MAPTKFTVVWDGSGIPPTDVNGPDAPKFDTELAPAPEPYRKISADPPPKTVVIKKRVPFVGAPVVVAKFIT